MLTSAIHLVILAHHLYVGLYIMNLDFSKTDDPYLHNVVKKFKWRFLTGWNFMIQVAYFIICVLEDYMRLKNKAGGVHINWVRRTKDFIFTSLFFPSTLTVSLMFWSVYLYDRELVVPISTEVLVPGWMNHSMHSIIVVALVIEMLIARHRHTKRIFGLAILATYVTIYNTIFFGTYLIDGTWLYPLPYVLNNFGRTLFFGSSNIAMFVFYIVGERVTEKLGGMNLRRVNEKIHAN